jgi:hypothetical protein
LRIGGLANRMDLLRNTWLAAIDLFDDQDDGFLRPNVRANRTTEAGRLAGRDEDTNAGSAGQAACRSGSGG